MHVGGSPGPPPHRHQVPRSPPRRGPATLPLMRWNRPAKIAFIGSHGIRKTTAAHAFASTVQGAGRSVEYGREVVRDNPLGINEGATGEAQLWVLVSQIRQELELTPKAEILVLDRGVMDNFAYYLRATRGADPYAVEPLIRAWSATYDLVVRLTPDLELRPDGVRSTNDAFRDEIEAILDARLTDFVARDRILTVPASAVQRVGGVDLAFVRLSEDQFELRRLVVRSNDGLEATLASGVNAGETVVTAGSFMLKTETLKDRIGAGCCDVE